MYHFRSQTNHHVDLDGVTAETVIMVSSSVKSSFSHSYPALICQRQENDLAKMETGAQKSELPKDILQRFKIRFPEG